MIGPITERRLHRLNAAVRSALPFNAKWITVYTTRKKRGSQLALPSPLLRDPKRSSIRLFRRMSGVFVLEDWGWLSAESFRSL
ncbi:hypothetical protein MTO96_042418 [Rhipicephalus appendiculatus]